MGLEVAALALAAAGAASSVITNRRIAGEQEDVQEQQEGVAKAQEIQRRRRDFRKRRIATARIRQAGENTGTAGSAGEAGAISSIATGAASFRAGERATAAANRNIGRSQTTIRDASLRNSIFQTTTSLARTGISIFSGLEPTEDPLEVNIPPI